ncbi:MAG: hypothetical protein IT159_15890 [Bryobacterales bacterium]|jgi:hypothetical protein|nr:hypothetical protein [Bryobacterales bacterium]
MSRRLATLPVLAAAWLGAAASSIAGAQPAASIQGAVVTDGGSPVAGARVLYNRVTKLERNGMGRLAVRETPLRSSVRTDAARRSIQTREPSFAVEVRGETRLAVELEVQ